MKKYNYSVIFKNFRKIHSLTQTQLADRFDVDQSRISKIENGVLNPNADEILHFLYIAGTSIDLEVWENKLEGVKYA